MSSEGDVQPVKFKRRRLQGSCDICRQKKIRCDSATMPGNRCSNCIAFDSQCTHLHVNQKTAYHFRQPSTRKLLSNPLSLSLMRMREFTSPLVRNILSSTYQAPSNPAIIHETLVKLAQYAQALEQTVSEHSTSGVLSQFQQEEFLTGGANSIPTPVDLTEACLPEPLDDEDIGTISANLKQALMLDACQGRFFGPSSNVMLVKTALGYSREYTNAAEKTAFSVSRLKRPEFWTVRPWEISPSNPIRTLVFPEPDLLSHLVDLFFINVNVYVPFLHRPTFERSIQAGLHLTELDFAGSVLGVCAIASRYSQDSRVILESTDSDHSSGWKWFRQLQFFRDSFLKAPSLYELQTYCLAVMYLQGASAPEKCWYLIALGIRAAQDVGINRRSSGGSRPTVQSELCKRVFWTLIVMEDTLCATLGRPGAINSSDYDLELPTECDDEYWENSDPSLAFKQPAGKLSSVTLFNRILPLFEIMRSAQRSFYSVRNLEKPVDISREEWNQRTLASLDSALNSWVDSIPEHLLWDPYRINETHFNQSAMLFTTFYWVQIIVHRPFIASHKTGNLSASSLAICTNAARSCSRIMDIQSRRGSPIPIPQVQMALFMSGIVLLLSIWRGKQAGLAVDQNKEMEYVHKCIKVLRTYEHRWHSAGRLCDILIALSSVSSLPLPPAVLAKRTRDALNDAEDHTCGSDGKTSDGDGGSCVDESDVYPKSKSSGKLQSASNQPFALPVYSEDLRKPIFGFARSEASQDHDLNPADVFPFLFADQQLQGSGVDVSPNFTIGDRIPSGLPADSSSPGGAKVLNMSDGSYESGMEAMAVWASLPTTSNWADWSAYISNVEGLIQEQQPIFLPS